MSSENETEAPGTFVMFGGIYSDVSTAEADYEAVKDVYYKTNILDTFDAAVISKDDKGKVKIHKKHEQPTRDSGWRGAGWGLATGLAIALFPAAAIGGGLLATTTAIGAGAGAVAGHVVDGMSRSDLKEIGEHLDAGKAAVIVAASSHTGDQVSAALTRADKVIIKNATIDEESVAADVDAAETEG